MDERDVETMSLEERQVLALEDIADCLNDIYGVLYDIYENSKEK